MLALIRTVPGVAALCIPGSYVRRVAHGRVLGLDLIADDGKYREPGVDADSHVEFDPVVASIVRPYSLPLPGFQSRTHRAFRVILMRNRRAKKRKDRITHQPRDRTVMWLPPR